MRVELVEQDKLGRVRVTTGDGERVASTPVAVAVFGIAPDVEIDDDAWDSFLVAGRVALAYASALRSLAYGDKTERGARTVVTRKGVAASTAACAVELAAARGWIDDSRLAGRTAAALATRKLGGPLWAAQDLARKGVERDEARAAVKAAYEGVDQNELAYGALVRRFGPPAPPTEPAPRPRPAPGERPARSAPPSQRYFVFLRSRGFESGPAGRAARRYAAPDQRQEPEEDYDEDQPTDP